MGEDLLHDLHEHLQWSLVVAVKAKDVLPSRELSLAYTALQEAGFWLREAMGPAVHGQVPERPGEPWPQWNQTV